MIQGATLFLDVEAGNGGLGGGSATDKSFNQDVLSGALEVLSHTERHTTAGLYISEDTGAVLTHELWCSRIIRSVSEGVSAGI